MSDNEGPFWQLEGPGREIVPRGREIEPVRRDLQLPRIQAQQSRSDAPASERVISAAQATLPGEAERDAPDGTDRADEEQPVDWSKLKARLQGRETTIAALALIVVSLIWKGLFLRHYYFRQDDFAILDAALKHGLSYKYLVEVRTGHEYPGVYLTALLLAHVGLYNWTAAASVVLIMLAGASLAAWRVLRTLVGDRPAILIPLVLYLLSPLTFPNDSWWIAAVLALPLQIAIFAALNSHVRYVWTGRFRHALAAAAWMAFGLLFFEKTVIVPLLLFAVTAGFLVRLPLLAATRAALTRFWKAWLLYVGLLVAYGVVVLTGLRYSGYRPGSPASVSAIRTFSVGLVGKTLLPGLLGGPWHWFHSAGSAYAYSSPPVALDWVADLAVLALIVASILTRPKAWRAWAILAGWVVLADLVPIIVGRLQAPGADVIFGMETRYVADATAVVAIVIGLACWPVARPAQQDGSRAAGSRREFFGRRWKAVAFALIAVFVVSSVWSVQRFQDETAAVASADKAYITTARSALAEAPPGTVIVDRQVPATIMLGIFKAEADTSVVLGPLSKRSSHISWVSQPSGNVGHLMIFGPDGRLHPASISGTTTAPLRNRRGCLTPSRSTLTLRFGVPSAPDAATLRLAYLASPAATGQPVTVTYGDTDYQLALRSGLNNAYFRVRGSASTVTVSDPEGAGLCIGDAVAGYFVPAIGGGIPAQAGSRPGT